MKQARIKIYIDSAHPRKNGKYPVSLRITCNRVKKYFPIGITITKEEYNRILENRRLNTKELKLRQQINASLARAEEVASQIIPFDFDTFKTKFYNLGSNELNKNVYDGFKQKIKELQQNKQIKSAISQQTTLNSLLHFKDELSYEDLNVEFVTAYAEHLENNGKSKATIGIYLRNLRTIFNRYAPPNMATPFGSKPGQFRIPQAQNIKKALRLQDIEKIFKQDLSFNLSRKRARDYWVFLYLCYGMNVKDFCHLRHKDLNMGNSFLEFTRAKTMRSSSISKPIRVALKEDAKAIIRRWGTKPNNPNHYVFPHLREGMDAARVQKTVDNLVRFINKHMAILGMELGIEKPVTTYTARHSFASVLKNSKDAPLSFISECLGHHDPKITLNYLNSFDDKDIQEMTNCLTAFTCEPKPLYSGWMESKFVLNDIYRNHQMNGSFKRVITPSELDEQDLADIRKEQMKLLSEKEEVIQQVLDKHISSVVERTKDIRRAYSMAIKEINDLLGGYYFRKYLSYKPEVAALDFFPFQIETTDFETIFNVGEMIMRGEDIYTLMPSRKMQSDYDDHFPSITYNDEHSSSSIFQPVALASCLFKTRRKLEVQLAGISSDHATLITKLSELGFFSLPLTLSYGPVQIVRIAEEITSAKNMEYVIALFDAYNFLEALDAKLGSKNRTIAEVSTLLGKSEGYIKKLRESVDLYIWQQRDENFRLRFNAHTQLDSAKKFIEKLKREVKDKKPPR